MTQQRSRDILRDNLAFAYGMLRGWRMRHPRISDVRYKRTVTHRPDIRPIGDLQELVHADSASFFCAGERKDQRTGDGSGCPHQSAGWNCDTIDQKYAVLRHALDPGAKPDFHTASREYLLRVSSQVFTQLRQDHRTRMDQHNSQHIFTQVGIEWQRFPHKVI